MLADTEWTLVTELARDHLLSTVEPHDSLTAYFAPEFVAGLPLTPRAADNAVNLVNAVRDAGLLGDDPPVVRLLSALADQPMLAVLPASERVREMLERERMLVLVDRQRHAEARDPFLATVLAGREVFIDRSELRAKLRDLHGTSMPKLVLQVVGEPHSGKSYSFRLIEHVAGACGFRKVPVILDESGTPEEVIETIALEVASTSESPPDRQDDPRKWYGRASQWLVKKARENGGTWWFVVDGLNHLPATSDVWDLIGRLAMAVDLYGDGRIRLVLLGHDGALDWNLRNRYETEHLEVLSDADVREFFTEWLGELYAALPPGERMEDHALAEQVDDTVNQILAYARAPGSDGACYMQRLGSAVEGVVRELAP